MAFDPLSWATGFVLSRTSGKYLDSAAADLSEKLNKAVRKWVEKLPSDLSSTLAADALFPAIDGDEKAPPALQELRDTLKANQLPTESQWLAALMERWRQVRRLGEVQDFFRCEKDVAETHLRELARDLVAACQLEERLFRGTVLQLLQADREDLRTELAAVREQVAQLAKALAPLGSLSLSLNEDFLAQAAVASRRKVWRALERSADYLYRGDGGDQAFVQTIFLALRETFLETPHLAFTAVVEPIPEDAAGNYGYRLICHYPELITAIDDKIDWLTSSKAELAALRAAGRSDSAWLKQYDAAVEALIGNWKCPVQVDMRGRTAVGVVYESLTRRISLTSCSNSLAAADYPQRAKTTSEALQFMTALAAHNRGLAVFDGLELFSENLPMLKLLADVLDHRRIDFGRVRFNVRDREEWDYASDSLIS